MKDIIKLPHRAAICFTLASLLMLVAVCTTSLPDVRDAGSPGATPSGNADGSSAGTDSSPFPPPQTRADFTPLQPTQYGSKVKALLTGLPLSGEEYTQLAGDDTSLTGLVDTWMATPQWQNIMLNYFLKVFQTGTDGMFDYANLFVRIYQINQDWAWFGWHTWHDIIDSIQTLFPRTALALVNEDAPFHQVLTTSRYMINTPMMALSAYLDAVPQDDNYNVTPSQSS